MQRILLLDHQAENNVIMKKNPVCIVVLCILILSCYLVSCKHAAEAPAGQDLLFPKVRNIINANCVVCHVPGGQGMPVFLTSDSVIVQLAAVIKAATCDPVSPMNRRMPPTGQLPDADTAIISQWFAGGGTMHNAGIHE